MALQNRYCYARWDSHPVSEGHMLVVPFRHIETLDSVTHEEMWAMIDLVDRCATLLKERLGPDGMNVGVNMGKAAGQTIDHIHIHIIPRYLGDVDDPRGGIRGVIPSKSAYPQS